LSLAAVAGPPSPLKPAAFGSLPAMVMAVPARVDASDGIAVDGEHGAIGSDRHAPAEGLSGVGHDDPVGGDLTDAFVPAVADVQVPPGIEGNRPGDLKVRQYRLPAVPAVPAVALAVAKAAVAGDGGDDTVGPHPTDPVVPGVGEDDPTARCGGDAQGPVQSRFGGRPPSPLNPAVPVPAIVVMMPRGVILRMRLIGRTHSRP